jgi:hypothetical protein
MRIPTVVEVIAVSVIVDINIIVVIPVRSPIFWPRVKDTEPEAPVLETRIPSKHH